MVISFSQFKNKVIEIVSNHNEQVSYDDFYIYEIGVANKVKKIKGGTKGFTTSSDRLKGYRLADFDGYSIGENTMQEVKLISDSDGTFDGLEAQNEYNLFYVILPERAVTLRDFDKEVGLELAGITGPDEPGGTFDGCTVYFERKLKAES
jgi:hypothetical protein